MLCCIFWLTIVLYLVAQALQRIHQNLQNVALNAAYNLFVGQPIRQHAKVKGASLS